MEPVALACPKCELRVEGKFVPANEFAALPEDQLHLLRVFVHCEGSIREMEAALGVSYPTVKARLAALRAALAPAAPAATAPPLAVSVEDRVAAILADVQAGRTSAADASQLIRELRGASSASTAASTSKRR